MLSSSNWTARSAWAGLCEPGQSLGRETGQHGLVVVPLDRLGLATLSPFDGCTEALTAKLQSAYGLSPPMRPEAVRGRTLDLLWSGPAQWMAVSPDRSIADVLQESLQGIAAVSDQSDGRAALSLSGPKVRETLSKGCPIDLHPLAFKPNDVALTQIGHIGVQLWRIGPDATFLVLVPRSMAGSFWTWLTRSAAEFGLCAERMGAALPSQHR